MAASGSADARRIVVSGATGVIGRALCRALSDRGERVVALSRDPARASQTLGADAAEVHPWRSPVGEPPPREALSGADAVINLLGETIAQRWSERAKQQIRDSRVLATRQLAQALRALPDAERPRVLVSQSATGFYGPHGPEDLDETSAPGDDWLARVVVDWETEATAVADLMRVAVTRTGVVLAAEGGALAKMLPFFKLGVGGPVAGGRQYISWIHLDDVLGGMLRCLEHPDAEGAVNLTAPNPVSNAEFSRALGRVLGRPALAPVPGLALRLLYGEMASIITTGQAVRPRRLAMLGYEFAHTEIEPALRAVLSRG
jgi:uncharacterized protein (TIGR01777 family)